MSTSAIANHSADTEIRKHRTAQATVALVTDGGAPLANREVVVAQTRHKFLFGSNGFGFVPLANGELAGQAKEAAELRQEKFLALFNFMTLPFYWGRFESQKGAPDTGRLLKTAQWGVDHGCQIKGHTLCWHTVCADWLLSMSNAEIWQAQIQRIQREVGDFKALIPMWDVVNEAVIMPVFDKYDNGITRICKEHGRLKLLRTMFETARAANPAATLLINDFDMSDAYDILVEGCLAAGIPIDAIGIQSHMHQGYWGREKTLRIIDHFSRFNLPIHFTEITLVSGHLMPPEIVDLNDYKVDEWPSTPAGEERQAREAVEYYQTLFAHPLVEAITWWDSVDGGWLHAPSGLLRSDATVKPAYAALHNLVKGEWWLPPTRLTTDEAGKIQFTGFLGDYELTCEGKKTPLTLDKKGATALTLQL
jgi:endo-1,4-beta-xylanase